jgi:hypothetical protein
VAEFAVLLRRFAPALAAVAVLAGCANVPVAGPVQIVREPPQAAGVNAPDLAVLAQEPQPGQSARDIVRGFLEAMADFGDHYGVARSFLSPAASAHWASAAGVQVYDAADLVISEPDHGVVTATAPRAAIIDASGDYRPAAGILRARLGLAKVAGQWRITSLPDGLLLSSADFQHTYRAVDLYYLSPIAPVLVADPVFLQARLGDLPSALVAALLAGPTPALAGAVRSSVPPGTQLTGPVTINSGVVYVPLNRAVAGLTPARYRSFTAQLAFTLGAFGVQAVQVDVPGISLPGPAEVSLANLKGYDPDVLHGFVPAYVSTPAGVRRLVGHAPVLAGSAGLISPELSADGRLLAGLLPATGGQTVVEGAPGRPLSAVSPIAPGMLAPSFAADDSLWVVADLRLGRQEVLRIPPHGPVQVVQTPGLDALGPLTGLTVSRDGSRVAVTTANGLYVATVSYPAGVPVVGPFVSILPGVDVPQGAPVWQDATTIGVLADTPENGSPAGLVEPLLVSIDGSQLTSADVTGLPTPEQLAAAPGQLDLLVAGNVVYQSTPAGWAGSTERVDSITYPGG